eukprot:1239299-Rhodomonas_salina.1
MLSSVTLVHGDVRFPAHRSHSHSQCAEPSRRSTCVRTERVKQTHLPNKIKLSKVEASSVCFHHTDARYRVHSLVRLSACFKF